MVTPRENEIVKGLSLKRTLKRILRRASKRLSLLKTPVCRGHLTGRPGEATGKEWHIVDTNVCVKDGQRKKKDHH